MTDQGAASAPPSVADLTQLTAFVQQLGDDLKNTKDELARTQNLLATKDRAARPNKPSLFPGKSGTIEAWCSHMDAYVSGSEPDEASRIACTYLDGEAFTWWQSYRTTTGIPDWDTLRACLIRRFNHLNKVQAARNKLHSWRQLKDVGTFNKTFLSIVMDIPDITESEKLDRYSHGLKRAIWEPLCIRTYVNLESLMTDALRIEAAKAGTFRSPGGSSSHATTQADAGVAPMHLSSIKVAKLTPEERQRCMNESLCLRCREKRHLAKDCPKGLRN